MITNTIQSWLGKTEIEPQLLEQKTEIGKETFYLLS